MSKTLENLTASMHVVLTAASFAGASHPNKLKFRGILVRLDEASDKPPGGAEGHRILLPSDVAQKRLSTLKGMGLNYSPSFDGHAQRRKVGVIDDAGIDGKDLWVQGYIWKHDFPEAEDDLKQSGLGMSMELGDVKVDDPKADVWKLTDCCFLGGTILWKGKAAYHKTRAIAAAKAKQGGAMANKLMKKPVKRVVPKPTTPDLDEAKIARIAASAAASAMGEVITGALKRQTAILTKMNETITLLAAGPDDEDEEEEIPPTTVEAESKDDDDEDDEDTDVDASGKKKDGEDDDEDEDEEDDDDEDDVDATSADNKPSDQNSDAKNHGDDTDEDEEVGPRVKEPITGSAIKKLRRRNENLTQKVHQLEATVAKQSKQLKKLGKQVTAAAEEGSRPRFISSEVRGLLSKSNINASELMASGQKLTTSDVDAIIASAETAAGMRFSTERRIQFKNEILNAGLSENGEVVRQR